MDVFLVWMGIVFLFFVVYILILWRRSHHRSRFRAKLTTIFLLFVFIPTVPLTFFIAHLLTQSTEILLIPGIGEALNVSLEVVRLQVEERGKHFLDLFNPADHLSKEDLEVEKIEFFGHYRIEDKHILTISSIRRDICPLPLEWMPHQESLIDALSGERFSRLESLEGHGIIFLYQSFSDSTIVVISYGIPPYILNAKTQINRTLGIYNTLSLLKESILQKNLIWSLAVLFVIGLVFLSVFTAGKLSRDISEPIHALVKGMRHVAEGELTHKVETHVKDELRFLVDSFNRMMHDLRISRQKLIRAERIAAWQEVARKISHEMRNSLTPVSISLRRLQKHIQGRSLPKAVYDSLENIGEELHSLQHMAAEFSAFARMPHPQKSSIDFNDVIQSVVRFIATSTGGVRIETCLSHHLPRLKADREQMRRLLNNLLMNSIEASHGTSIITIITNPAESPEYDIQLQVQDQGEGMDEKTLDQIFHPYYTTKLRGTGLGLVIVQKIVEDHNGQIQIESQKGEGTCVTVWL